MRVIIVGGGKTGSHLAAMLIAGGHTVRVVEDRAAVLERLRKELPAECLCAGDGSSPEVLEAAGVREAQVLAAVTGADEANLVTTTLARFEFNVPRVIARVNNPKNAWMFSPEMGVDVALVQADLLAKLIAEEMSMGDMMTLLKLRRGQFSLFEEKIPAGSPAVGVAIRDLSLKENAVIAAIIRHGELVIPRGTTRFEVGDEVLTIGEARAADELASFFGRAKGKTPD
jgi:trk system potassium uptake protein TrkA